jgi:hypothetical protein
VPVPLLHARRVFRYTSQIKELKRLLSQRVSYREVLQQAEIARLTRELDSLRHSTSLTGRARSSSRSRQPSADVRCACLLNSRVCGPLVHALVVRTLQIVVTDSGHGRFGWCSRMNVRVKESTATDSMLLEKSLSAVDSLSKKVRVFPLTLCVHACLLSRREPEHSQVATFAERNTELERSFKVTHSSYPLLLVRFVIVSCCRPCQRPPSVNVQSAQRTCTLLPLLYAGLALTSSLLLII